MDVNSVLIFNVQNMEVNNTENKTAMAEKTAKQGEALKQPGATPRPTNWKQLILTASSPTRDFLVGGQVGVGVGCIVSMASKGWPSILDPKNLNNLHALDCLFLPPSPSFHLPPPLKLFGLFILYAISDNDFPEGLLQYSLKSL